MVKNCSPDKIFNPKTGRCVKKDGKIGMAILSNFLSKKSEKKLTRRKPSRNSKKCSPDKIINPETGRCVKKDGKIGLTLLAKENVIPSKKVSKRIAKKVSKRISKKVSKRISDQPEKLNTNLKYIKGPVTLSEHKNPKYDKHIYLFGDIHVIDTYCPGDMNKNNSEYFNKFLKQLLSYWREKDPDMILDYFIEFGFRGAKTPKFLIGESYLGYYQELYNYFLNCVKIRKNVCEFKNLRLHYSDTRHGFPETDIVNEFGQIILSKKNIQLKSNYFNWDSFTKLLSSPEKIFQINKIDKQIDGVKYPKVKKLLIREKNKVIITSKFLSKKIDAIKKLMLKGLITDEVIIFDHTLLLLVKNKIMDIYLFARMFKEFKPKYKNQLSKPAENILIYVGNTHATTYREWLKELGFSIKEKVSDNILIDYQCVNVSDFKQPFFS